MQYGKFALVYDKLMSGVDYEGWARYLNGFLPEGASLLECACGTGELTRRFAAAGHSVIATDVSEDMLGIASEKLRLSGALSRSVRFANMDMRSIAVHKPVDAVVCCCDGVNYLLDAADVKRFFIGANAALKPGGLLLFDVSSRYKLSTVLGNNCFADNDSELPYMWQNNYDADSKLIGMELAFFVKKGELYERFDETHVQRAHSQRELASWLDECGFDHEAYACFTQEPPSKDTERIQFVARKRI